MGLRNDAASQTIAVEIAFVDLDRPARRQGLDCLSDDENARARRFVFERDRVRFMRGRAFLRHMLGGVLDLAPANVAIETRPNGKPFVKGDPIRFNLSHSGHLAVLAMSREMEIGIDIELVGGGDHMMRDVPLLAERVLNAQENRALKAAPDKDRLETFLTFWTAKEAHMKLTGDGLLVDPAGIALNLDGVAPTGFLAPDRPPATLQMIPVHGADHAVCALATCQIDEIAR